jgi:FKBP-type peptidyl-prolyl cis-trans isomerase SlyD
MVVEPNMHVVVRYQLRTTEGTLVDPGEDPIEYVHGYGMLVPGLEIGLAGMKVAEKRTIALEPEDAFGEPDEHLIFAVDAKELPEGAKVGDELTCESPDGDTLDVRVVEIDGDEAVLDANHPLAGMSVVYDVEVMAIRSATDDEIRAAAAEEEEREQLVQLGRKSLKS